MNRWLPTLLSALCLGSCNSADPLAPLAEAEIMLEAPAVVELTEGSRPIVQVSFGESEAVPFLVDSGADSTLIDESWATRVGLRVGDYSGTSTISGSGAHTLEISRYAYVTSMRVGELEVQEFFITATDDNTIRDYGFGGVIGQDLLGRLVSIFDMENSELHLLPGELDRDDISTYLGEAKLGAGTWLAEPTLYRPRPFLPFAVSGYDGESLEILIDTGADSCSFPAVAIDALALEPLREETYHGIGGGYQGGVFEMTDFQLAGFQVSFEFHQTPMSYGILGMDVLSEFVFLLDPRGEMCWIHHRKLNPAKSPR